LVALMAAFTVVRHTRLDEETGRREMLGATVLGRHAPLVAAFLVTLGAGACIAILVVVGLIGLGEAAVGAAALGLTWLLVAAAFAAFGALAAQLTESAGAARAVAGGVIGVFFAVRMAGDGGENSGIGWLSWLSPLGWVNKMEPYGEERWWVAGLFAVLTVVVGVTAFAISARRDVGAGAFPPRSGPASASLRLSTPIGLAWRLQRGAVIGWSIGVALFATIWGGLADTVGELFEDNPQLADIFEALGGEGTLTDIFFGAAMGIMALIVSAYSISTALTLHTEEVGLRAEPILATATPRLSWAGSHLVFALAGPVLIMALAGLSAGITYGAIAGDMGGQVADLIGAALLQLPAIWVVTAIAVALYGLAPRLSSLSWGVLVALLLLGQLGQILQLPQWVIDMSPFTHIPTPPDPITALPLLILTAIAAALLGIGLNGFQRRDLV